MRALALRSAAFATLLVACVGDSPRDPATDAGTTPETSVPDTSTTVDASPASATLTLTPPPPLVMKQGATLDVTIAFARNGVTGPIALVPSGAATGTAITIAPVGDGALATQMKITTLSDAVVGKSVITLKAANVTDFTFPLIVAGPAGVLDTSFDGDGIVLDTALSAGTFNAVATQSDGKTIVVGSESSAGGKWLVRRYNEDGTLDTAFNSAVTGLPTSGGANAVAIDPKTNKVVVAGNNGSQSAVLRFQPSGAPDQSFDGDGAVATQPVESHFGGGSQARAIAILADSSILVAGTAGSGGYVIHYKDDGARDSGFTDFFTVDASVNGTFGAIYAITNGIFVTGSRNAGPPAPLAARLLPNGAPDLNFSATGLKDYSPIAFGCTGGQGTMAANGDAIILGKDITGGGGNLCEVRTTIAGAGTMFGSGGGSAGQMGGATPGPNGSTYVDGWYGGSQDRKGFIRRRLANGNLDPAFSVGGEVLFEDTTPSLPDAFTINFKAIATLTDGRVVAVGQRVGAASPGPFIYRLWP